MLAVSLLTSEIKSEIKCHILGEDFLDCHLILINACSYVFLITTHRLLFMTWTLSKITCAINYFLFLLQEYNFHMFKTI